MSVRKREWITRRGETKTAWVVDYAASGSRHLKTFARKKDADAYSDQTRTDVRAGTHTPVSKSITVAEAAEQWITAAAAEGREASTLAQYRQHARHINQRIGTVRLARLTPPMVNQFRDDLLETMSPPMARIVLGSLKALLRDAHGRGLVAQNVALSAKRIKANKRLEDRLVAGKDIPRIKEIGLIIGALKGRWRPPLMTAIFAGLRASELRGLRWQDIDFEEKVLHVRQRADRYQKIGPLKSASSHRKVPLGPMVLNTLREWKLKCPPGELDLAFPTASGKVTRLNNLATAFAAAVERAGLLVPALDNNGMPRKDSDGEPIMVAKYTGLHTLRHFYASWCINPENRGGLGLPPKVVQEHLGHSTLAMTMDTYGHLFPRTDDEHEKLAVAERALLLHAT